MFPWPPPLKALCSYCGVLGSSNTPDAIRRESGDQRLVPIKISPHLRNHVSAQYQRYLLTSGTPWSTHPEMVKRYLTLVQADVENTYRRGSPVDNLRIRL
jgi:hypothetical protein